ncbi:hypothetical protein G6F57_020652 [Rhizopus arrhizus]|nr:hypothetical protein G6F57_020652 [Rhizopus arrhizus]
MSAMRRASRAALPSATAGASCAHSSRYWGREGSVGSARLGSQRVSSAAYGVKSGRNTRAITALNSVWKLATARAGSLAISLISGCSTGSSSRPASTPSTRVNRLPSGSRRAAGSSPVTPSIIGLMAVPRLAPSTSAKAT